MQFTLLNETGKFIDECPLIELKSGTVNKKISLKRGVKIHIASFECKSGFKLVGDNEQRCNPYGSLFDAHNDDYIPKNTWSGTKPHCKRIGINIVRYL